MNPVPDSRDIPALQKWFKDHSHLSINDLAQLADLSANTIRKLKKKAGFKPQARPKKIPSYRPIRQTPTIEVPLDWRNDLDWLRMVVNTHGFQQLCRLVDRNVKTVSEILKKRGIKSRSSKEAVKSKNKFCTKAWCHHHYVVLGYPQHQCAELAGICTQTFSHWLNRFKIPVRDEEQAHTGRKAITLWEKDFIGKLRQKSIVRRVYVRDGYIHVRFRNYYWENYYTREMDNLKRPYTYFRIDQENSQLNRIPAVHYEYGVDVEGQPLHPAHISLSRADLKAATMVERRLAIHEYARRLLMRDWVQPSFPEMVLAEDFRRVQALDAAVYLDNGGFTSYPKIDLGDPPGRKLMMAYFDFSEFQALMRRPRLMVRYLTTLEKRTVPFNLFNLLLTMAHNSGFVYRRGAINIPDPMVYAAIFKHLGLGGTLLDVKPGKGNRAVAAAAVGLNYTTSDPSFQNSLALGFQETTGLNYVPDRGQKVDVVLYDEGFRPPDMQKVLPYLDRAKKLMVFCPRSHSQEVLKYKPREAIKVRTRWFRKDPDHIFIW